MLAWIDNAPMLEKNSEQEMVHFVENYLTCNADNEETVSLVKLQTHKHSRTCRKKGKPICRFSGSTVGFLLLQCSSGVVRHPSDLQVSVTNCCFCRVLIFVSSSYLSVIYLFPVMIH